MHGLPNLKICIAKQAKQIFHYKKIKIKLFKNCRMSVHGEGCQRDYNKELPTLFRGCFIQQWIITNDLLGDGEGKNTYRNTKNPSEYVQFPDRK